MKRNLYLTKNGRLCRQESTIYYYTREGRRAVPVNQVKAIFAVGRITVTSGAISFFSHLGLPIHFFGHYGTYEGSFYPRKRLISGHALIRQAAAHMNQSRRTEIARSIVTSCVLNMMSVLSPYRWRKKQLVSVISELQAVLEEIPKAGDIPTLMSIEGRAWNIYYGAFDIILTGFTMGPRVRRPPNNPVNALISFGNSLLYSVVLTQLYHTQLDPSISFLHEPLERRFSLALDISEVFKPGFVDVTIFRVLNTRTLSEDDFERDLNYCVLNEEGRRKFLLEFDALLRTTVKHPGLRRNVSNELLIRLDCYKLLKAVVENRPFVPFLLSRGM
ncbi:MAG: type I-B CRISPR-associated endonuclease Cas1b [Candidatus Thorarchaeota archaeon]